MVPALQQRDPKRMQALAGPPVQPQVQQAGIGESLPWLAPAIQRMSETQRQDPRIRPQMDEYHSLVRYIGELEDAGESPESIGRMTRRLMDLDEEASTTIRNPQTPTDVSVESDIARSVAGRMQGDFSELNQQEQYSHGSDIADAHEMERLALEEASQQKLGEQVLPNWLRATLPDTVQGGPRVGPGVDPLATDVDPENRLHGMTDRPAHGVAPMSLVANVPATAPAVSPRPVTGTVEDDVRRAALGGGDDYPKVPAETGRAPQPAGHGLMGMNTPAPGRDPGARGAAIRDPRFLEPESSVDASWIQRAHDLGPLELTPPPTAPTGSPVPLPPVSPTDADPLQQALRAEQGPPGGVIQRPGSFDIPVQQSQGYQLPAGILEQLTPETLNTLNPDPNFMKQTGLQVGMNQGFTPDTEADLPKFLAGLAQSGGMIGEQNFMESPGGMSLMQDPRFYAFAEALQERGIGFDQASGQYQSQSGSDAMLREFKDLENQILAMRSDNVLGKPGDFNPGDPGYDEFVRLSETRDKIGQSLREQGVEPPGQREITGSYYVGPDDHRIPNLETTIGGESAFDLPQLSGEYGEDFQEHRVTPDEQNIVGKVGYQEATKYGQVEPSVYDKGARAAFEKRESAPYGAMSDEVETPKANVPKSGVFESPDQVAGRTVLERAGEWLEGSKEHDSYKVASDLQKMSQFIPQLADDLQAMAYKGEIQEGATDPEGRAKRHQSAQAARRVTSLVFGSNGLFEQAKQHEDRLIAAAEDSEKSGNIDAARAAASQARDLLLQRQAVLQTLRRKIDPIQRQQDNDAILRSDEQAEKMANRNYRFYGLTPAQWDTHATDIQERLHGSDYSATQKAREAEFELERTPEAYDAGEGLVHQEPEIATKKIKPSGEKLRALKHGKGGESSVQVHEADTGRRVDVEKPRVIPEGGKRKFEIPNPKAESLRAESQANRATAKQVSRQTGAREGLNRVLSRLGLDTYQGGGATEAENQPKFDAARAREAEQWRGKPESEEGRVKIARADPATAEHYLKNNPEFAKMIEEMHRREASSEKKAKDLPIDRDSSNPYGFRTIGAAMTANDMILALERGGNPSEAFSQWKQGEDTDIGDSSKRDAKVTATQLFDTLTDRNMLEQETQGRETYQRAQAVDKFLKKKKGEGESGSMLEWMRKLKKR